jgi:hypothetical protein
MSWLAYDAWQVWAVAGVAGGVAAWLFFLKVRHPRRTVPSLVLWQRAFEQERPRSVVERLRRAISLLIILAVAWLLALAPGRPASVTAGPGLVTIVVDTAPSMAAKTRDGRSRLELAKDRAREIIAKAGPTSEIRLLDTAGAVSATAATPPGELLRALDRLATRPGADRRPAPAAGDGRLIVITDGVRRRAWTQRAERVSVFEPAVNVRLAAFAVRPLPARPTAYQAYVEIVNDSPSARHATLSLRDPRQAGPSREIDLAPGAAYRDVLDLDGLAAGELRATVTTSGDGFALDDEAVAYLPAIGPFKTLLVTEGNPPLEAALGLDPFVDLSTLAPPVPARLPPADVIVFDRHTPVAPPASPSLLVRPSAAAWLAPALRVGGEVPRPAVRAWDTSDPLLQYVRGEDIRIDRAARIEVAPGSSGVRVIAASDATPLVIAAERPVRLAILAFDLRDSDLPFQVGFPMLVRNAVLWLAGVRAPFVTAAGTVRLPWPDAEIRTSDDRLVPAQRILGGTVFEAGGPGLFFAMRGTDRVPVVVGLAEAATGVNESEPAWGEPAAPRDAPAGGREWWPIMLAVAFVLATVEWVTFHRRVTL